VLAVPVVDWLAFAGTFAFAVSGALLAARHRLDIIGFLFVANMTGVGGGTVRDLLLGAPVFWVQDATYIAVCSAAALLTYAAASLLDRASQALLWADAVGIALFAVLGAQKALLAGVGPGVAVVMGIFTACFGGVIRDVMLNETPIIMSREIYITATLAGALCYVLLAGLRGAGDTLAIVGGTATGFAVRALAIAARLSLPSHAGLGHKDSGTGN
jgi:uncharacterized membrane protein YeiH